MSDLEEDLLALAGAGSASDTDDEALHSKRSKSTSSKQVKKKRVESEGEDEEAEDDYNLEEEEQEEDEEDDYDPEANLYDQEEEEEDEEVSPYALEGKYKNEKDKEELEAKPEVEREAILFERLEEVRKFNEHKLLRQRAKQNQVQKERATRAKKVKETSKSVKSSVRSQLKKQREKKSRKERDYDDDEDEVDDDDEEESDGYDFEDIEEDDYEPDFKAHRGGDVEWAESSKRREVNVNDINSIRTGHSVAEKYCFYPNFVEVIVGTYGKIRISKTEHRMVRIDAIRTGKPYLFGQSKIKTDQYFTLSQPGKDQKNFQFGFLSDEYIKQEEFEKYKHYIKEANNQGKRVSLPTIEEIQYKHSELKRFSSQKLDGEVFTEYLNNRNRLNKASIASDALSKRLRIEQQLEVAVEHNDKGQVEKLTKELKDAEKLFDKTNTSKVTTQSITAKISERNRKLNMTSVRQAELRNSERKRTGAVATSDPFARLTTRARVYYHEAKKEENDKAKEDAILAAEEKSKNEAKEQKLLKFAKYRALGELDRIISTIDYQFDIEI